MSDMLIYFLRKKETTDQYYQRRGGRKHHCGSKWGTCDPKWGRRRVPPAGRRRTAHDPSRVRTERSLRSNWEDRYET